MRKTKGGTPNPNKLSTGENDFIEGKDKKKKKEKRKIHGLSATDSEIEYIDDYLDFSHESPSRSAFIIRVVNEYIRKTGWVPPSK